MKSITMGLCSSKVERDFERIAEAPNRRDWGGSSPLMVNAFYGPNNNGLWIPAGILQSPFFDASNSDARNYGSIGSVLGHEMSHGFDDNGRQYDARGDLHDWWGADTIANYKKRSTDGCHTKLCGRSIFLRYLMSSTMMTSPGPSQAKSIIQREGSREVVAGKGYLRACAYLDHRHCISSVHAAPYSCQACCHPCGEE